MTRRLLLATAALAALASPAPASARILKSRLVENTHGRESVLTVGSAFEYESTSEQTELGLPFLVEYGLTRAVTVSAEPRFVVLLPRGEERRQGVGEIETSASCGLVAPRGARPALAATGKIVWPVSSPGELGAEHREYSVGLMVGRVFRRGELDVNVSYRSATCALASGRRNAIELSCAAEYDLGGAFDVLVEVVSGGGGGSVDPALPLQAGRSGEGTIGLAQQVSEHLMLEAGVVLAFDGARQVTLSWEWDFGDN